MRTVDHLALGRFLLEASDSTGLHRHVQAFLLGCVEPDYNQLSYLRGFAGHRKFRGHNAENSFAHVSACVAGFEEYGLSGSWDYFTLGTVLHYVADAFTWPHNSFWSGGLIGHAAYEIDLHRGFADALEAMPDEGRPAPSSPVLWLEGVHREYAEAEHGMETDTRYILRACGAVLLGSLRCAAPEKGAC